MSKAQYLNRYQQLIIEELKRGGGTFSELQARLKGKMSKATFSKHLMILAQMNLVERAVNTQSKPPITYYELKTSEIFNMEKLQLEKMKKYTLKNFPEPFVINGKANSIFVFGATRRFDKEIKDKMVEAAAVEDVISSIDLIQHFSKYIKEGKIEGWIDSWDREYIKNHNLIVVGSPRVNLIARELNENKNFWFRYITPLEPTLASHYGGRPILDPVMRRVYQWIEPHRLGLISFGKSPYNPKKYALLIFGHGAAGTYAAALALQNEKEIQQRPFGGIIKGKVDWSKGMRIGEVEWLTQPYTVKEYIRGVAWARKIYSEFREKYPKV